MQTKPCSKCGEHKPLDAFSPDTTGRLGRQSRCRACRRALLKLAYVPRSRQINALQDLPGEEWRQVAGCPVYAISNFGRLKRTHGNNHTKRGGAIKTHTTKRGYEAVTLKHNGVGNTFVHRMVAAAFIGVRPEGYQVNHKDGNKLNNRADNLEYMTNLENRRHAMLLGLHPYGERIHVAKLTEHDVRDLRRRRLSGEGFNQMAREYGMTHASIRDACVGRTWKHVK